MTGDFGGLRRKAARFLIGGALIGSVLASGALAAGAFAAGAAFAQTKKRQAAGEPPADERVFTPRPPPTPVAPTFRPVGVAAGTPRPVVDGPWSPPPVSLSAPDPQRPFAPGVVVPATIDAPPTPIIDAAPRPVVVGSAPAPASTAAPASPAPAASVSAGGASSASGRPEAGKSSGRFSTGGASAGRFSEWEGNCILPEDLPDPSRIAKPGTRLRVRVDAFIRKGPSCNAAILDVVEAGEIVTTTGGGENGWYRARHPSYGTFWIGAKLLAPLQQP